MNFKSVLGFIFLAFFASAGFAQSDLQIKKKVSRTLPGMEQLQTGQLSEAMAKQLKEMMSGTSTVYVKGSSLRTDTVMKVPNKTGGSETHTFSTVLQCDKQQITNFDTRSKKFYQYPMGAGETSSAEKKAKTGGYITITGTVTDTGERAKLFGFDARRFKQTIIFTPGAGSCLKQRSQLEIDGWYAEVPGFSCPVKTTLPENAGGDCLDELDYQVKGAVTGVALKEIKKISFDGQTMTIDEEAIEVVRTTLADSLFEPPAGYKAGKAQFNSSNASPTTTTGTTVTTATTSGASTTLPLPTAGIEKQPLAEKKPGVVRIGVAKPKVTTPDSKKDANAGAELSDAVVKSLIESLKAENVEAVPLETDSAETECREKGCDYIFYASVVQKRGGGGGMFGKMLAMGAASMIGGMIPGAGGIVASTVGSVLMSKTMGKSAKAKDEFAFEYKTVSPAGEVLTQAATKAKAKEDGEDVLTPQIKQASAAVLGEIAKKK